MTSFYIRIFFLILFLAFPVTAASQTGLEGKIDLKAIPSVILFQGDEKQAYRDPAVLYHNGVFHLFFTYVQIEEDGRIYSYTAHSSSRDLVRWNEKRLLTPKDQRLNYSSPGNVIRFGRQWILCLQTYPRPGYIVEQIPHYGDSTARVFLMRSDDLVHWSQPELIRVKGPDVPVESMGRMIDPYLLRDKDQPGKWWCFYKQNGISMSYSYDLKTWIYFGKARAGENVCVLVDDDEYVMFHSPSNGIGVKRSTDLRNWRDTGLITLGQVDWPWAKGRLTAGAVLDLTDDQRIGRYLMFFHGSGPESERVHFDNYSSLGIAWSKDLETWEWSGKDKERQ
ncbi:MAG: hypothetical protein JXA82_07895 [Sedimentisphaerales bacterium]|nr:hypothetical protein [Sedimentisphaerales bacterium]